MPQILLVDDDELLRKMLRITLVKMGYEVREAVNGVQALKLFEQQKPDVVLTDIVMPEKEGLEIIGELRRRDPAVKIVAMSGGGRGNSVDYLKIARVMGAKRVLVKPFSNDDMTRAIEELLSGNSV